MPQVEFKERARIALDRVTSLVTGAKVFVNDAPHEFPEAATEEIHLRRGKFISILFDGDGLPIRRSESPTDRLPV